MAATPDASKHTSIRQRVTHAREKDAIDRLKAAKEGTVAGSKAAGNLEQDHWLSPIEDRRSRSKKAREGMIESFSLGSYLLLVDYTSRIYRNKKTRVSSSLAEIFDRLGSSAEFWSDRMRKMLNSRDLHGRFFAGRRDSLKDLPQRLGIHHVHNLSPQC